MDADTRTTAVAERTDTCRAVARRVPFSRPVSFGYEVVAAICLVAAVLAGSAPAADFRTQNFIVMAPTPELAQAVGNAAEDFRRDLAVYWVGRELPPWPNPCPIRVVAGNLAAQGVTTYNRSPVRDFQMEVVGSPERILDSVLPHEVTHTILATHFGRPLPRWADEGICTTVEHPSERRKHETKLREFLRSRRGIAMNKLFLMTEYPSDVLPMYAQGYSVCQFLIAQGGPRNFVDFLGDYMQKKSSWTAQVRNYYGYESLAELQEAWLAWVADGSGSVDAYVKNPELLGRGQDVALAAATAPESQAPAGLNDPRPARQAAPAASPIAAQPAGNRSPVRPPATASAPPSNALAANTESPDSGWYARLRHDAIQGEGGGNSAPANLAAVSPQPPAGPRPAAALPGRPVTPHPQRSPAQRHSAAQPQPEYGVGGGGYRPGSVGGATYLR